MTSIKFWLFQLKWHDEYDGHGEHYFDFNHGDSYKPAPQPSYGPAGLGSEPQPQYDAAPDNEPQFRI